MKKKHHLATISILHKKYPDMKRTEVIFHVNESIKMGLVSDFQKMGHARVIDIKEFENYMKTREKIFNKARLKKEPPR